MCNTCWWYSISLNQTQVLRTLRTGVSYQGKKAVAVFSLDGLRSGNWNETVQVMRNQIRSGRELPHVEKLYFIPTNLQLIILDSLHFLDEIHCWEPDQNRNGAYGNPIASSQRICTTCGSTLIYIGNRRKKEKKRNKGCQTHQNPTYQLQHHYGGPLRGASAGLATKLIISAFFCSITSF